MATAPADTCPKCNADRLKQSDYFGCMSKLVWSIFRHRIIVEHSQGCRIRQLEAVILKIDRMASAWLSHGREEAKPFAREVFDVCEQAIQAASGAVSELAVDSSTPKTAEKPVEQR